MNKKIIENAVIAESSIMEYMHREHITDKQAVVSKLNKLLYEVAENHGMTLYELCSAVYPEISTDFTEATRTEEGFKCDFVTTIKLRKK